MRCSACWRAAATVFVRGSLRPVFARRQMMFPCGPGPRRGVMMAAIGLSPPQTFGIGYLRRWPGRKPSGWMARWRRKNCRDRRTYSWGCPAASFPALFMARC